MGGLGVDQLMVMQMCSFRSVMSLHVDLWRRGLLLRAISPANQQQESVGVACPGKGGGKGEANREDRSALGCQSGDRG